MSILLFCFFFFMELDDEQGEELKSNAPLQPVPPGAGP